jgi:DNA topoisomerase VI subunit B
LAALCGKEKLAFEEPHVAAEIEAAVQEVAEKSVRPFARFRIKRRVKRAKTPCVVVWSRP